MNRNIQFEYLYRDGANYKAWGTIVFSNPAGLSVPEVDERLRRAFNADLQFVASQIGVPEIFLYRDGNLTSDDHCFHEYDRVELTDDVVTDMQQRTVSDFLAQVEIVSQRGWEAFNPCDWIIRNATTR
jgi:hypothetical protein